VTEHHELISAHLDGELSDTDGDHVRRAVAEDPSLARHAEELARVRQLVRDLPPVDPPFGVLERMVLDLRRFRPSRTMVSATWGAAAAAVVLVVALAPSVTPPEVVPDVEALAARGEVVATEPIAAVAPADDGYETVPVDDLDVEVPDEIDGAEVAAAYEADDITQVVYGEGEAATSVFVQDGSLDRDGLAAGGERATVAGDPAWRSTIATPARGGPDALDVVVVDRGDVVVVVVSATVSDAVEAELDEFDRPEAAWSDGVVDACGGVVETFGFDV
jgi:hypothetical protein